MVGVSDQLATGASGAAQACKRFPAGGAVCQQPGIRSLSQPTNSSASSVLVGSSQILGFVTMRTNPLAPSSDSAKGSGPAARARSQLE